MSKKMSLPARLSAAAAVLVLLSPACVRHGVRVVGLACQNRVNPVGVDPARPVFGWELASGERGQVQTAFRILAATSASLLEKSVGDVWDSGRRQGSGSAFLPYAGKSLSPGREYFWKVMVWDGQGRPSTWSETARFTTGLSSGGASAADAWSGARWIAFDKLPDAMKVVPGVHGNGDELGDKARKRSVVPLFRKEFDVRGEPVARALVFVCGLGQYELRLNGRKVGSSFLAPGWTDYRQTCLYNTYDVTALLRPGRNAVGAVVGNGFFNVNRERYRKLVIAYGLPMMIARLDVTYVSGRRETITSGTDWKTAPSPITFSSIYGGEDYDARLEQPGWDSPGFDDAAWRPALDVPGPGGSLEPEGDYPLAVEAAIAVKKISEPRPGVFVYDFGQNASGIIALKVKGERGRTVTIRPAELLGRDGLADQSMSGSPYLFSYTLKGGNGEDWTPRFTYYGFRYAQVEGAAPADLDLRLLHTRNSSPAVGSFACSKELFNRAFTLIEWAIRSNLASVPTDCPHREKLGWLEQTHLMGGSIQYNYRILTLYQKLVRDMAQAQLPDGLVPDIAPEYVPFLGGFRDSPEWGSAAVILPWLLHEWYGDTATMAAAYPMMKRYVDYLGAKARGHILDHGLGDWFDNPPSPAKMTPRALTATAIYYRDIALLSAMARKLGRDEDAAALARLAEDVRRAFNARFFDPATKIYAAGSQTAYATPLHFGIVDEADRPAVFRNFVRSIRDGGGALTAGDVGFDYVLKALAEGGAADVVFEMNSREDVPGYGYQLARGATALTESWAAREDVSNNHMMLGHIMEWFYSTLAGIGQAAGSTGFERIEIRPHPVGDVTWAKASYRSIRGEIAVHWRIDDGRFLLDVKIPANATARVFIPTAPPAAAASGRTGEVLESGLPASRAAGVKSLGVEGGRLAFEVGSGEYHFASGPPRNR